MGIHGLTKVIADHSPRALKENTIAQYFGRKIAIDASMSIYQFMIAVRSEGNMLTNSDGQTTSHLMGMFYRTIRMVENGIKPLYVFDGKPPSLKSDELDKRLEKREEANKQLAEAIETGNAENYEKFNKRTLKVTKQHNEECKRLLGLLGIPFLTAPCEAEAQCAALVKAGKVFATGSEDMDTLTFGSPILLRHLTFSEARKMPISEIHLDETLKGLEMDMDMVKERFIDLCILLGCDYCDSIKGIGPHRAINLIKTHKNLEGIIENLDKSKYEIPLNWPYKEARKLFKEPEVVDVTDMDFKWSAPDEEGVVQFMVNEMGFDEKRIRNGVAKLVKNQNIPTQGRLDSFFKVLPKADDTAVKRKLRPKKQSPMLLKRKARNK